MRLRLSQVCHGVLLLALLAGMGGCATQPVASTTAMSAEEVQALRASAVAAVLKQNGEKVDALLAEGKAGDAVELLRQDAEKYPEKKEPWSRLAKIHFDGGDYGEAIQAADEVLERDEADRQAKAIRAVSGLRVASQSLVDLRDDAKLQGSARADAVNLVKVLRENLGEDVLLPTDKARVKDSGKSKKIKQPHYKKTRYKKEYTRLPVARKNKEANAGPPMSGDPFSVLH